MNAREYLEFYLDSFLDLYRNHRDMLRFNHFFNSYVENEHATAEQMRPYLQMVERQVVGFYAVYQKATEDGTVRTDIPETTMVSSIFHIMLAAVTRYAAGLVYVLDEINPEDELILLRNALLREFTTD